MNACNHLASGFTHTLFLFFRVMIISVLSHWDLGEMYTNLWINVGRIKTDLVRIHRQRPCNPRIGIPCVVTAHSRRMRMVTLAALSIFHFVLLKRCLLKDLLPNATALCWNHVLLQRTSQLLFMGILLSMHRPEVQALWHPEERNSPDLETVISLWQCHIVTQAWFTVVSGLYVTTGSEWVMHGFFFLILGKWCTIHIRQNQPSITLKRVTFDEEQNSVSVFISCSLTNSTAQENTQTNGTNLWLFRKYRNLET